MHLSAEVHLSPIDLMEQGGTSQGFKRAGHRKPLISVIFPPLARFHVVSSKANMGLQVVSDFLDSFNQGVMLVSSGN
ncbi:hypothetical protein J122_4099 [Marinobacter excellens LAMA 842]|uniref:Uncharacterized protein n=1 Tax=Marinobacter excellens LAMA 842 TaxID=1306954 RepID=A0A137S1K3_9GAMM|nr:hypothetical protein J122_4099 [Marinobacter excellens LAMA 842]